MAKGIRYSILYFLRNLFCKISHSKLFMLIVICSTIYIVLHSVSMNRSFHINQDIQERLREKEVATQSILHQMSHSEESKDYLVLDEMDFVKRQRLLADYHRMEQTPLNQRSLPERATSRQSKICPLIASSLGTSFAFSLNLS